MPYTKQELQDVDFYQDFVNELRNRYLEQIQEYTDRPVPFSDENIDLYLFEDIITGMGIEDAQVTQDSIYKTYLTPETQKFSTSVQTSKYSIYDKTELLEKTID